MEQPLNIKYVANYLRKSRGESDTDLDNHRLILDELATKNGWSAVEYAEIETGDSIARRPEMQRLLNDVASGIFDAVCVVDIDRLGRGDLGDQDKIKKAFANSETCIVTPQHIYNLDNENDEFSVDIKSFIARQEYKQIIKRLSQGKKIGARRGRWTNGTPPYPYEYERWGDSFNPKGLVVNTEKLPIYRMMVDKTINEIPPSQIAFELNRLGIPSPRGGTWSGVIVYRLMLNETHLGWIVSNKTKGDGHAHKKESSKGVSKIPRDMWSIVKDCHEATKSTEEHSKIKLFYSRLPSVSKRKPNTILSFTGLIKCGICGRTMGTHIRARGKENIKPCWYRSPEGVKCKNSGGVIAELVYSVIESRIIAVRDQLMQELSNEVSASVIDGMKQQIAAINSSISSKQKAFEKASIAYEAGVYTLASLKDKKVKLDEEVAALQEQREILEQQIFNHTAEQTKEKIEAYNVAINSLITDMPHEERNAILRVIIDRIIWTRDSNHIDVEIIFK